MTITITSRPTTLELAAAPRLGGSQRRRSRSRTSPRRTSPPSAVGRAVRSTSRRATAGAAMTNSAACRRRHDHAEAHRRQAAGRGRHQRDPGQPGQHVRRPGQLVGARLHRRDVDRRHHVHAGLDGRLLRRQPRPSEHDLAQRAAGRDPVRPVHDSSTRRFRSRASVRAPMPRAAAPTRTTARASPPTAARQGQRVRRLHVHGHVGDRGLRPPVRLTKQLLPIDAKGRLRAAPRPLSARRR